MKGMKTVAEKLTQGLGFVRVVFGEIVGAPRREELLCKPHQIVFVGEHPMITTFDDDGALNLAYFSGDKVEAKVEITDYKCSRQYGVVLVISAETKPEVEAELRGMVTKGGN